MAGTGSYNYYKMFGCFNRKFKMSDVGPPPDVLKAFNVYSGGGSELTPAQLLRFLVEYQGEVNFTIADAEELLQQVLNQRHHLVKYTRYNLDVDDFFFLLFHEELNPPIGLQVHHDMTAPLQQYFIYTGHNSYLTGNQLSSDCSDIPIINALERGVRGIELDLWPNSTKDDIHVLHGRTLTTPVRLDKCFQSIKQHAFLKSPYPVIVTLEDHLNPSLRAKVAEMAIRIFGELLYYPEPGCFTEFPSPEELKHHIILSTKPPKEYLELKNSKEKDTASPLKKEKYTASPLKKEKDTASPMKKEKDDAQGAPQSNNTQHEDNDFQNQTPRTDGPTESDSDSDIDDSGSQTLSQQGTPGYKRQLANHTPKQHGASGEFAEDCSLDHETSMQLDAPDEHDKDKISECNRSCQPGDADEHDKVGTSECNKSSQLVAADEPNEGGIAECNKSSELGETDEHTEDCGMDNQKSSNLEKTDKHTEVRNVDNQISIQLGTTDKHSEDCTTDAHQSDQLGEPVEHSEDNSVVKQHPKQNETPEKEHSLAAETCDVDKNENGPDSHLFYTKQPHQHVLTGRKPLSSLLDVGEWNEEDQANVDDDGNKFQLTASAYKHLIAIHADKPRDGLRRTLIAGVEKVRRLSLSEQELARAAESYGTDIVRFTQKNLVRVYPKGTRVTSSNFRPLTGWMVGAQMVAFNMQGYGRSLWLMHGMFRANGGCGYVKKPKFLMKKAPAEVFDPKAKLPVKKTLKVKVYLGDGWRLDFSHTHFDAYSPPDFYTKVRVVGVPADIANHKTRIIEDDWTPTWDEEFEFPLTVPELALLQIVVQEYDLSEKDDFGGQTCFPVTELRPGIRAVPLYDKKGLKYKSVKLLMRFQFV
ncbi:Phosphoinositide phospholipase C [Heracleum sosnowskyi]|uniref:Phosphoinositide phospholipase C n=1 Tax=Heracleum sosnowskyi TaxID=360622 RepID=A0AAD8GTR7_9APIA|nr:Phosphoinositide phospholipase C [Heracleum sosnowskyi]